nr:hypothetical protein [uncultured Caproiciproducens sp.]
MNLHTKYGCFSGCIDSEYYEDGSIKNCGFAEKNEVSLKCGTLVPQYGEAEVRKKYIKSIGFYQSGVVQRIALEKQTEVLTPIGEFPAELLTFYEDGSIKRIFPLNGKISGYWSEADEGKLAFPLRFEFDFGDFLAKIISIHFYPSGEIQSITLFPGEVITLRTPAGKVSVRTGFSIYESGALKSVEPAYPVLVPTKIGKLTAYDCGAIGIHADDNSLKFSEAGEITGVTTSTEKMIIQSVGIPLTSVAPIIKPGPLDEDEFITIPVTVRLEDGTVYLTADREYTFPLKASAFTVIQNQNTGCTSCSDCSLCGKCPH